MGYEPLPGRAAPVPVSDALDAWAQTVGMGSVAGITKLFGDWATIVGAGLAERCRPVSLDRGRLVIEAADQVWATELTWMTELILQRCTDALGSGQVESVHIRSAPS